MLMETLDRTQLHYIKCIKPNNTKTPNDFDSQVAGLCVRARVSLCVHVCVSMCVATCLCAVAGACTCASVRWCVSLVTYLVLFLSDNVS